MRCSIGLVVVAMVTATSAWAQATPAYQTGFQGLGTSSNYPANPCAQCGPSARYAVQAEPHDVRAGDRVIGGDGAPIGWVVAANGSSAVVRTPATLVRVPIDAFGKSMHGLVLNVSRATLEGMAQAAGSRARGGAASAD